MKLPGNNPLKPVLIAGLILTLIISWALVLFILIWRSNPGINPQTLRHSFRQELAAYDDYDAPRRVLVGENPAQIERLLLNLENQAGSVEEYLSVLKRRRALALIDRRYINAYEGSARRAAEIHAYSAPLALMAAEALLMSEVSLREDSRASLREYASRLSQSRFSLPELGLWILAGDLDNPARASDVPWLSLLLSQDLSSLPAQIQSDLGIYEFLLLVYQGNVSGASFALSSLLSAPHEQDHMIRRMGAEFYYDHNNYIRSAELFSHLQGERDLNMAASALTLAGNEGARNFWLALAGPEISSRTRSQSFYNLAASADTSEEAQSWLERFLILPFDSQERLRTYGILRYIRLLDTERAVAILEDDEMRQNPLLDMELLRLQMYSLPQRRAEAEVWMLLNRHEENEDLHEWAAWYFDHQRLYGETLRVLRNTSRSGMTGTWIDLHRGLALIREGNLNEGEMIFREGPGYNTDWRFPANLGRIQEGRRAISSALAYYEAAAALVTENKNAAQIQLRISRCLEALGRAAESRRALERALELDPENLHIHREIRRL